MKFLMALALLCLSLTTFAGSTFDCYSRNGKFGIMQNVVGQIEIHDTYIYFMSSTGNNSVYSFFFKDSSIEHTRTGSWITFNSEKATLVLEEAGEVRRAYMTTTNGTESMKCYQN